jgi:hypothetical protein
MKQEEMYYKMVKESVKDLFKETVENSKIITPYDDPKYGEYTPETCGYYDPTFKVEIAEDTNPQTSTTGNNHDGPAEVWIDGVMTHHTSNLMSTQPEVLSREKYNCDKDWCEYRWYWIAFRASQKIPMLQMWVNCALIKGNGKSPIPVEPTPLWRSDPRGTGIITYLPKNLESLAVSYNPSEKFVSGYSSGTFVSAINGTLGNGDGYGSNQTGSGSAIGHPSQHHHHASPSRSHDAHSSASSGSGGSNEIGETAQNSTSSGSQTAPQESSSPCNGRKRKH